MPPVSAPYFFLNSFCPRSTVKGMCVSLISRIPLFFWSIYEQSTTILSNLSVERAPVDHQRWVYFTNIVGIRTFIHEILQPYGCPNGNSSPCGFQKFDSILHFDMLSKELGDFGICSMKFSNNPNESQVMSLRRSISIYLATSAALRPAAEMMIVWGAPFFLDADHSLVELPENRSKKPGRLSRVLDLSQDVVSWIAVARYEVNKP